jgi:hypothetical protein
VGVGALFVALSLLVVAGGGEGCQRRAVGPNGEATLVTDLAADSPAIGAVRAAIGRDVMTTRPEPAFTLDVVAGGRFRDVRSWRNLILVADLDRPGPTTALVERTVGPQALTDLRSAQRVHAVYGDVWARGQTVLVVAARGETALAKAVTVAGDAMYAEFEAQVLRGIGNLLYVGGEETRLARDLAARYGWSLRIPAGYRTGEAPGARFVRFFMREGGARLLFVYWQDGVQALPSPAACLALRDRLAARYYEGDFIDSTRSRSEPALFQGRPAHRLVGIWQNDRFTMGGPFRTYCFVDRGRFVMIDLAVFEPMESKVELLRQLEAIALTYRDERSGDAGR